MQDGIGCHFVASFGAVSYLHFDSKESADERFHFRGYRERSRRVRRSDKIDRRALTTSLSLLVAVCAPADVLKVCLPPSRPCLSAQSDYVSRDRAE